MKKLIKDIDKMLKYLGDTICMYHSNKIKISDKDKRSDMCFIYTPGKNIIKYSGNEVNYHNGDYYDEITLDIEITKEILEEIKEKLIEKCKEKAEEELEEYKQKQKDHVIEVHLNNKGIYL